MPDIEMINPKKIGKYDRRVTIRSTRAPGGVDTIDTFGAPQKVWQDLFTCWASREESAGAANQEQQTSNRTILPGAYAYYMHYRAGVDTDMRLRDEGIDYHITSAEPVEGKMMMRITVEKVIK